MVRRDGANASTLGIVSFNFFVNQFTCYYCYEFSRPRAQHAATVRLSELSAWPYSSDN